jgi:hypothetical protein
VRNAGHRSTFVLWGPLWDMDTKYWPSSCSSLGGNTEVRLAVIAWTRHSTLGLLIHCDCTGAQLS